MSYSTLPSEHAHMRTQVELLKQWEAAASRSRVPINCGIGTWAVISIIRGKAPIACTPVASQPTK
jgi:hypothetical protein